MRRKVVSMGGIIVLVYLCLKIALGDAIPSPIDAINWGLEQAQNINFRISFPTPQH